MHTDPFGSTYVSSDVYRSLLIYTGLFSLVSFDAYTSLLLYTGRFLVIGERWGAGVETQKNVRGEIGGWGRVPFNEPYASSLSTIYDGAQGSLNS